jgi:myo-inositol-1-phosphate synthase
MGPVLDGVADHMANYPDHQAFRVADKDAGRRREGPEGDEGRGPRLLPPRRVGERDPRVRAGVPRGRAWPWSTACRCSSRLTRSGPQRFRDRKLPIVGDDIKSQVGATIIHRQLARLIGDRGAKLERTYQLNTGGNTDFLNMLEEDRLKSKRISKTESVQSQLDVRLESDNIHIGPSDFVPSRRTTRCASCAWSGAASATCRCTSRHAPLGRGLAEQRWRRDRRDPCAWPRSRSNAASVARCLEASAYLMKHPPRADARQRRPREARQVHRQAPKADPYAELPEVLLDVPHEVFRGMGAAVSCPRVETYWLARSWGDA